MGSNLICFQYDVAVDGDGLKMALKTALHFGHAVSGKSKDQFAKDVRPYLKVGQAWGRVLIHKQLFYTYSLSLIL